jgi:hypothetical protein
MKTSITLLFAAACFLFAGCNEKKTPAASDTASGNPLTAPADYVGAVGQAQKSMQKTLGTVGIDQALKAFSAEEGRYPKDLNELVTKGTISQIPPPPRGMKYDYDAKAGTIKVVPE